ncbi:MAG: TetR/AcrR family transcriptional regulator [Bdellovibrionaceae bacterium]|nr:TetR/AcrR family transcriptional regulator [Pseudobdellovibrionaceae bacterium]
MSSDSSKENILKEANRLFAEKGYTGTSVRELAEAAEVNVAAINYHFGSKQGLFEAAVKDFTQSKLSMVMMVLEPTKTLEEFKLRITMFMKQFLLLASNEHEAFRMLSRNLDTFAKLAPKDFKAIFVNIHNQFLKFVESAQKSKIIRPDIDAEILTQILFGGLMDLAKNNELRKAVNKKSIDNETFRDQYVSTFVDGILNGVGVKDA